MGVDRQVLGTQMRRRLRRQTYECQLHGTTEASCCRFTFLGPAVTCLAGQREVGFGSVGSDSWSGDGGGCSSRGGSNGSGGHDYVCLYAVKRRRLFRVVNGLRRPGG